MKSKKMREKICRNEGCNNIFIPYRSTDKYCCASCAYADKKKPIRHRSKKLAKREVEYFLERKKFLDRPENKICPITGEPTTDVHHKAGRVGKLLLYVPYWLAVSRNGHDCIHNNPKESYEKGYLIRSSTVK